MNSVGNAEAGAPALPRRGRAGARSLTFIALLLASAPPTAASAQTLELLCVLDTMSEFREARRPQVSPVEQYVVIDLALRTARIINFSGSYDATIPASISETSISGTAPWTFNPIMSIQFSIDRVSGAYFLHSFRTDVPPPDQTLNTWTGRCRVAPPPRF